MIDITEDEFTKLFLDLFEDHPETLAFLLGCVCLHYIEVVSGATNKSEYSDWSRRFYEACDSIGFDQEDYNRLGIIMAGTISQIRVDPKHLAMDDPDATVH